MAAVAPVAIQSWKVCAVVAVAPVMVNVSVIASEQVELVVVPVLKVAATVTTGVTTVVEKARAAIERRMMNFILILMRLLGFLYGVVE